MEISSSKARHISKIFILRTFKLSKKYITIFFKLYLKKIRNKSSISEIKGRSISFCIQSNLNNNFLYFS